MSRTVVYSKPQCSFCDKAKHLLKTKNIPFEERIIGKDLTPQQLFEEFEANNMPQPRSVPQIILHGKYVGGYDKLVQYIEDHGLSHNH